MSKNDTSIENKMKQLRELAEWFESDDFDLDKASDQFKKASTLAKEVETELSTLKNDITVLKQSFEEM